MASAASAIIQSSQYLPPAPYPDSEKLLLDIPVNENEIV